MVPLPLPLCPFASFPCRCLILQASFFRIKELLEEMIDPSDPFLDEMDYLSNGLIKTKQHRMFHYHSVE